MRTWAVAALVAVGCSSPQASPDAAPSDSAAADAVSDAAPDAGPPPIRVTVLAFGTPNPLAGVMVKFVAPDSSVQSAVTNASGIAEASSPAGTTVMVATTGEAGRPMLKVFEGAMPGDAIVAGNPRPDDGDSAGPIAFAIPTMTGADGYSLAVSCTNPAIGSGTITVSPRACPAAGHAVAVAWPTAVDGTPLAGPSILTNLDLASLAHTTVQMPAFAGEPLTVTSEVTNLPRGATDVEWESFFSFDDNDPTVFSYATSSPAAAQMTMLPVGDRTTSRLHFRPPGFQDIVYEQMDASRLTDFAVDASASICGIADPSFSPETSTVSWTESATGRAATMISASLTIVHNGADYRIEIHAPHGATPSLVVPGVPAAFQWQTGDRITVRVIGSLVEGMTYDQMLQVVDTHMSYLPARYDPRFVGKMWSTQ